MRFYEVLDQAVALLRQRGRVTYRALKREFQLDPTLVEGLIPLFSSAASAHNVIETRGAQIPAA
jgi:hypothetical protein